MEKRSRPIWSGILSGLLIAQLAAPAWAQNGQDAKASEGPPTRAELAKLQNDVFTSSLVLMY